MNEAIGMVTEFGDALRLKVQGKTVCLEVTVAKADVALERICLTPIDALTLSNMLVKAADAANAEEARDAAGGTGSA